MSLGKTRMFLYQLKTTNLYTHMTIFCVSCHHPIQSTKDISNFLMKTSKKQMNSYNILFNSLTTYYLMYIFLINLILACIIYFIFEILCFYVSIKNRKTNLFTENHINNLLEMKPFQNLL